MALCLLLSVFAGRLVQIQGLEAPAYASSATNSRLQHEPRPALRGAILDADGIALATTVEARDVVADQTLVHDPAATAAQLSPLLGTDVSELTHRLTGTRRFVYLARQVGPDTWRAVSALQLPGVLSRKTARRVYPAREVAANLVGFVGADGRGLAGVEQSFDGLLAGRDGKAVYEVGAGGRRIPLGTLAEVEPEPGRTVALTIDRDVQWVAQEAITAAVRASAAESGTVVVLDVRTGDLLALATAPTFDPNRPAAAAGGDRGNRAISDVYEPGSTAKVLTAAAAIEEKVVRPDTPVTVPDELRRGGTRFSDSSPHDTLQLTFTGVLAKSSNIGTILASERLAPEVLHRYLARFGIGGHLGLGLPGESAGILAPAAQWSASQNYTIRFGQGYSVTAVQLAAATAAVANNGVRVPPRVVRGWTDEHGRMTVAPAAPGTRVVSPATARSVVTMMEAVVGEGGTAPNAAIPGYRVAGKTGTANRVDPRTGRYRGYTASFIGMAPADAPRLVVAVTLQAPRRGRYGGRLAAPVFKEVMSFTLQNQRIPPTGTRPPRQRLETD